MPKNILVIGNYGAGNLGDDAIFAGILENIKTVSGEGKQMNVFVTHGGKRTSTKIYQNVKKVPFATSGFLSELKRKLKSPLAKDPWAVLPQIDMAIIGGGGLMTDVESSKAPKIWLSQAKKCQKMNIPYLVYGQSVGILKRKKSRARAKKFFNGARAIHMRDEKSKQRLRDLGIEKDITVGTDLAFNWLKKVKTPLTQKDIYLLNVRLWPTYSKEMLREEVEKAILEAERDQLKPVMLSMEPFNQTELNFLRSFGIETMEAPCAHEAFKAMQVAKKARIMRLHAHIFALAAGTHFSSISYAPKVKDLLHSHKINEDHILKVNQDFLKAYL